MRDFITKVNNAPGTAAGQLDADEFNEYIQELENFATRAGLTLNQAVLIQLAQAGFLNGVKAQSFQAGGAVDAIELTPISGASGVALPADYAPLGGAIIEFLSLGPNTGNVTVNFGQTSGTLLGTKELRNLAGAQLPAGTLPAAGQPIRIQFDTTNDRWFLVSGAAGVEPFEEIDRGTVSSAVSEVDVTWGANIYQRVDFEFMGMRPTSDAFAGIRVSTDNGLTFEDTAADYAYMAGIVRSDITQLGMSSFVIGPDDRFGLTRFAVDNVVDRGIKVRGSFYYPSAVSQSTGFFADGGYSDLSTNYQAVSSRGEFVPTTAVNAIRFFFTSAISGEAVTNIEEGDYLVRGWF